ncbi:MAG: flagellar hook-associated protein FlgK [Parvularculaceae bacterium]
MSLNVALNTAVSGLMAHQRAIAATAENIANVNTPEFARREANFFTDAIPGEFAGVDVEIARAAADRFLQAANYLGNAGAAGARAIADAVSRIEGSLGAPGDNLSFSNKLDEAFAALTALSANPSSLAARGVAVSALDDAFRTFARTQDAITEESDAAAGRLALDVERANALLEEIFRLNGTVPDSPGAADLIDARLAELSELISINVARNDRGQVEVTTDNGRVLASAGGFAVLGAETGPPTRLSLSSSAGALAAADISGEIASGEIKARIELRNTTLPQLAALVEGAARGVADALNAEHALNVTVGATAPSAAGNPLIVEDASGRFSVNAAIRNDLSLLAVARPPAGGVGGANDGFGAAALADVGASTAAGNVAEAVAQIGATARSTNEAADTNEALAAELSARVAEDAGVNLDEELSNLILYQRAYSASARVISAVDELYQTLLSIL